MKVLVVEDEFVQRKLLTLLLGDCGTVDGAANGREAVEAFLFALEEEEPYDLVCLDIQMPEKDGKQVLAEIRAEEERRGIVGFAACKVLMVTSLHDLQTVKESFENQCDGYLVKPVEREAFDEKLRELGLVR